MSKLLILPACVLGALVLLNVVFLIPFVWHSTGSVSTIQEGFYFPAHVIIRDALEEYDLLRLVFPFGIAETALVIKPKLDAGDALMNVAGLFGSVFSYCAIFLILLIGMAVTVVVGLFQSGSGWELIEKLLGLIVVVAMICLSPLFLLFVIVSGLFNVADGSYYATYLLLSLPAAVAGLSGLFANPVQAVIIIIVIR